jgi:hypothetical protein
MGRVVRVGGALPVLTLAVLLAASGARADMKTPIFGVSSHEFSLWPVIYVGHGSFSIPGVRITEDSWSIPFIHYESKPKKRFDLTPVYHYTEGDEGFALGPRRQAVNDGLQGLADTAYDLATLSTNTRQFISNDEVGYQDYREYGQPSMPIPGHPPEKQVVLKTEPAPVEPPAK